MRRTKREKGAQTDALFAFNGALPSPGLTAASNPGPGAFPWKKAAPGLEAKEVHPCRRT